MITADSKMRGIKRMREIVSAGVKYGLGPYLNLSAVRRYGFLFGRAKDEEAIAGLALPRRLRLMAEELGPTFIKLGQILSTRPDLIPREYVEAFTGLQDNTKPFPFGEAADIFTADCGRNMENAFAAIDKKPVAAASLGQVYKARLKTGEKVAVKIQRPGISRIIDTDMAILYRLAGIAEKRIGDKLIYPPREIVSEFSHIVSRELDFRAEARHIEIFGKNFSGNKEVVIPAVYPEFTNGRVITMEYIEGVKINDVIASNDRRFDKKIIASRLVRAFLKQVFEDGFFHGDLHPGNILILPGDRIAFLDFGAVGRIDEITSTRMADALSGVIDADADKIIKVWQKMDVIGPLTDTTPIRAELTSFLGRYFGLPLKEIEVGRMFSEMIEIMSRHKIKAPVYLALLSKAFVYVEGLSRRLDPDMIMISLMKPYIKEFMNKKYSFSAIARKSERIIEEGAEMFEKLPHEIFLLTKGLREGNLNIGFKHLHLDQLILVIDRASNRLAFGLIIASLIIGSSLIINFNKGPFILGYPAIGIAGYLTAAFFGLGLIVSIIRRGRL